MGKHIAEHLLKTGKHIVTAIARPSSISKLLEDVQIVRVDYSDDDNVTLMKTLREQQVLIIIMSMSTPSDTIIKFVRAAAKVDVPYVLPN
jgi:putative NADH-flavin reductase